MSPPFSRTTRRTTRLLQAVDAHNSQHLPEGPSLETNNEPIPSQSSGIASQPVSSPTNEDEQSPEANRSPVDENNCEESLGNTHISPTVQSSSSVTPTCNVGETSRDTRDDWSEDTPGLGTSSDEYYESEARDAARSMALLGARARRRTRQRHAVDSSSQERPRRTGRSRFDSPDASQNSQRDTSIHVTSEEAPISQEPEEQGATGGQEVPIRRNSGLDCAICLQPCVHPARLPCSHIFCFLCLKGFAQQSPRCAMCRTPIPHDYLDRPELVEVPEPSSLQDGYQWFYEGRNGGWWQFEARMSADIEARFLVDATHAPFDILICGALYVIDLGRMIQYAKAHPGRKRKIKRELGAKMMRQVKGVAGIH